MSSRRANLFVLLFVIGLTVASVLVILDRETKLGLDLRGGTELVYQATPTAQTPEVNPEDVERAIEIIRRRTDALGVAEPEIARVGADQIVVSLPDVQNADRAVEQVGSTAQLYLYDWEPNVVVPDDEVSAADERPFNSLYDAVKFASTREPECDGCVVGDQYYLFEDGSQQLIAGPESVREDLFVDQPGEEQPPDSEVLKVPEGFVVVIDVKPSDDPLTEDLDESAVPDRYFVIRDRPALSGTDLENPEQNFDQFNQPIVTFDFTDEGQRKFQEVTREIAQRGLNEASAAGALGLTSAEASNFSGSFAIILDNEVVSRPIINFVDNPDGIDGRNGAQISGGFTLTEAQDLAEFLKIGALPVKLRLISQSTVSATLGEEALDEGVLAAGIGLAIVLLFLFFYYRFLGLVAGLGLLVYAVFFYALVELIPITLTLPGIAGLILTIGVAADSNIVIFERIKEEVAAGRSLTSAIAEGYRKGIGTIIDANVITLITAFILFVLATAGVKGFAFTLGVGTIVSLFTAVVFTQAILGGFGRSRILRSPRLFGAAEPRIWRIDFAGRSKWFFSASGAILAAGAIAMATLQLNLGIDFESGTRIKVSLAEAATVEDVRTALDDGGIDAGNAEITVVTEPEFGANVFQIQGEFTPEEAALTRGALDDTFGVEAAGGEEADGFQSTSVGPTFGEEVAKNALRAIILSLLVICAYVAIRFEAKYAVPVLIAIFHDILLTAGVYALAEREVTSGTVAAFLTILGYSLYDTVIVFDRIRENVPRMPRAAFTQIVNRSMNEVLTRSLITGLSTTFLIAVLLAFGGETLKDFAFAMLVGVASGTYSSIFIAAPVLSAWKEREPQYRNRREQIEEGMGYVPAFAEDNEVARIEAVGHTSSAARRAGGDDGPGPARGADTPPARPAASTPQPAPAETKVEREDGPQPDPQAPEPVAPEPATSAASARSARRQAQQKHRRKHGRNR